MQQNNTKMLLKNSLYFKRKFSRFVLTLVVKVDVNIAGQIAKYISPISMF